MTVLEGARAATLLGAPTAAASASSARTVARSAPARSSSPPAARPRCGSARPTRPARWASACCSRAGRAPRWPTSSSCSSTPPRSTGIQGREGFLVTEAIRGEGATLLDADGERFVDELAPRDEVARAIWSKMTESGRPSVDLDMRAVDPRSSRTSSARCARRASTRRTELVPVAPAAHYGMGGIVADLDGATTVPGLYAVGESVVHGPARRQPPGLQLAHRVLRLRARAPRSRPSPSRAARAGEPPTAPALRPPSAQTRAALWRHAGLVRDAAGLQAPGRRPPSAGAPHRRHALLRAESRGAHTALGLPRDRSGARPATTRSRAARRRSPPSSAGSEPDSAQTPPVLVNGCVS